MPNPQQNPQQNQPPGPVLLRTVIDIPEPRTTSDSDFVLKLTEGVADAEATLRDYVVTDRLLGNFDEALGLISAAVGGGGSRAAYLHGSFGSGKSHFMAVLHALLRGEQAARGRDEFTKLLTKHDRWLAGRKFLLVPYHLLGAKSLEQAVLGGYADHVRGLHPDAPVPAVHRTDALLDNARHLRARIGDAEFISGLPGGGSADSAGPGGTGSADAEDEWGEDEPAWDTGKLDAALGAAYDDEPRRRLVSDLLTSWFPGFFSNAKEDAEGFVSLDRGLAEISRHAQDLGYHGLVLFLDELILWLASSIGDQRFVAREVQKITNFVEGGDTRRAIPVVSFIARQRDLRELVGEEVTGAAELGFQDALNLASGRFDVITLEDRNLPVIAHQRLLRPIGGEGGEAAAAVAAAFGATTRVRREVLDTLLGTDGATGADLASFRLSYPFSPAFVDTLVHVSSALQRSRTALKLLRQLLIDHRDDLRLGQLVPLGDLYDVLSRGGDQPFTQKLKVEFETAQKLYEARLRPYLLGVSGLTEDDVEQVRRGTGESGTGEENGQLAARVKAFTGDDRLAKTLLLSALAPTVPALRNLTARRLSALNHGSITSPIPGGEIAQVARKVEEWAGRFGEVKFAKGDDPGVGLELVGVDVDSVLATAGNYDHTGSRKNLVSRLLREELGVTGTDQYADRADLVWRGSRRSVEVLFGNVRDPHDLRDDAFHPLDPTAWRVVVDYPFDESGYSPADDRGRVHALVTGGTRAQTVCWLPAALTAERMADLRRLVIIDTVLSGQRFDSHAQHLNPTDRHRARAILESQRDALTTKIHGVLRQAYGLAAKQPGDVVASYEDHLLSLTPGLRLTLPVGAAMRDALRGLAGTMLAHQYPAHPDFDPDRTGALIRPADARMVLGYVRAAVEAENGYVEVDRGDRGTMRRIANPLRLGEMHDVNFVPGRHWAEHFHRKASRASSQAGAGGDGDLRAADLLAWLDDPSPRGLDKLVAQLVLACFAEQTDRAWVRYGGVLDPQPELAAITGDLALREQNLPDEATWQAGQKRAMDVLGVPSPPLRRGRLVTMFVRQLTDGARQYAGAARSLVDELEKHAARLGLDLDATGGRLHTARVAADLLDGLGSRRSSLDVVAHLAHADLGGPTGDGATENSAAGDSATGDSAAGDRTGRSIRSAQRVASALAAMPWDTLDLAAGLGGEYAAEAEAILAALHRAARADELTTPLPNALERARAEAAALLRKATKRPPPPPSPQLPSPQLPAPQPPSPPPSPRERAVVRRADPGAGPAGLRAALDELSAFVAERPGKIVEITWREVD